MILNFSDFARYKYNMLRKEISDNAEMGATFNSKNLLFTPEDNSPNSKFLYKNLSFIEFNNYELDESVIKFLSEHKTELNKISHLSFWNSKMADLSLLQYFEKVQFLSIAHILDSEFTFNGLTNSTKLKTLCLLKTGKTKNFKSIGENNTIENFSIVQPTTIKSTTGIKNLKRLKYLNIEGSADKVYTLDRLNELEHLKSLEKIKLHRLKVPFQELITSLKIPNKIELEIDTNLYDTKQYKELGQELKNVTSLAFNPYIERRDFFEPIGKGMRIIKKTDKRLEEKIEKLVTEWNS